ncbi:MAG: hypothetical protein ACJAS1_001907 [Oleiphilaceae bacterium]|jgi:hypothetical protein
MELNEFLLDLQTEIKQQQSDPNSREGFAESIFTEMVMSHMSEIGMSYEPNLCHYEGVWGNAKLKLSGYAFSEDLDGLDLFVSHYQGVSEITALPDSVTKKSAEQCLRFLGKAAEGKLSEAIPPNRDEHDLVLLIEDLYNDLDQIRIFVITDCQTKSKKFAPRELSGKLIQLEVLDIERLHNHLSAGKPRDEIVFNALEAYGSPLPCVFIPDENDEYEYALTALPGEMLRFLYERYGDRLLETNVRSFLSQRGKVNKGIRDTIINEPERFMAYNNGVVIVADSINLERTPDGSIGIASLQGLQIVNGGQTTASLFFTKRKSKDAKLDRVRIAAKIILIKDPQQSEKLVSQISQYANSQNAVRQADLSSNKQFHIDFEKMSTSIFCPDGTSKWFYERSAGSYNVMLTRGGATPAALKKLRTQIPTSRKITKTDLAKFLFSWEQRPDLVSLGGQKNFIQFMEFMESEEPTIDPEFYKSAIAKTILFKDTQKICRKAFEAFQGNIANYTVSILSLMYSDMLSLNRIWIQQELSYELKIYITQLAHQVKAALEESTGEKMMSEWAKRNQCWLEIREVKFEEATGNIPELK